MRVWQAPPLHLTYCLNVHPGETWAENFRAIRENVPPIRNRVLGQCSPAAKNSAREDTRPPVGQRTVACRREGDIAWSREAASEVLQRLPDIRPGGGLGPETAKGSGAGKPFGLGLRLSAQAARELAEPRALAEFRSFLADHNLYVFTINGFPYGQFHAVKVKENAYRPDWRAAKRRDYTIRLADILAALLPDGMTGSISTVPGSYRPWITSPADVCAMIQNLMSCVAHLGKIRARTGKEIHVGLEPEPDCFIETTDQAIEFFEGPVTGHGVRHLSAVTGKTAEAREMIARHLGVCFDTCHMAIQFEDLGGSLDRLRRHGIRISKLQISAALQATIGPDTIARLKTFLDPVYLHQVKGRAADGKQKSFNDLAGALAGAAPGDQWRIHFHVPLYFEGDAGLTSTRTAMTDGFFSSVRKGGVEHMEIETYTFDVLPESVRRKGVQDSVAAEYEWVLGSMGNG